MFSLRKICEICKFSGLCVLFNLKLSWFIVAKHKPISLKRCL
nr:MAG TPA: hypothetical protein [Caudoviricetes sp.]